MELKKTAAIDADDKVLDYTNELKKEAKLYRLKYGKIHPILFDHIHSVDPKDDIQVTIWFKHERADFDKSQYTEGQLSKMNAKIDAQESLAMKKSVEKLELLSAKLNFKLDKIRQTLPVAEITTQVQYLEEISKNEMIDMIFMLELEGIEDLSNALEVSNADAVIENYGYTGSGIKVAVFENGPDDTSELQIADYYDTGQSDTSRHATTVIGIIKNRQSNGVQGFAPGSKIYSANKKNLDALEWAIKDKRCSVVNQSFHQWSEPRSNGMSLDDMAKDYWVYHYPYPMIVHAAGNYWQGDNDNINPPSDEYVNHKGFNTISVGNHNDDATAMSGSSVFRNPHSPHGDRELPEISANGTGFNLFGSDRGDGTSYASPAVAGVCALLQESSSKLKFWPEGTRALLLAGARKNMRDGSWWNDVRSDIDGKDGAGAMDAKESIKISHRKMQPKNVASNRGWDVGTFVNSDFDSHGYADMEYFIRVPKSTFSFIRTQKVKVALCWTNKVDKILFWYFASGSSLDLDLKIYDKNNVLVASSNSWDNSFEIAEFEGRVGEEYRVRIRKWSGSDRSYYGIAWTAGDSATLKLPQLDIRKRLFG